MRRRCVAFGICQLGYVHPKSFVPLGLLANISQMRLSHSNRPLSREVSSATPHPAASGQQTLCCEFERLARAKVRHHRHQYQSSSHLSTTTELGGHRTCPAQGLSRLRWATSSPSLEYSTRPWQLPCSVPHELGCRARDRREHTFSDPGPGSLRVVFVHRSRPVHLLRGQRMFHAPLC